MTSNDMPEFDVTLKMARKIGPLHADVEYRTFTLRGPAINAEKAEDIAYGLGHGINDATDHAWKFHGRSDCVTVAPAADKQTEIERLREQLFAQKPVIDAAQAWAEMREVGDVTPTEARHLAGKLHDAIEQYRLMDLALTSARDEQPAVTR